uniref:Dynein regulatory complex subunit 7 n=1 Tax=Culicoides sonorensis TaxID=179676 RepID=A0A336LWC1_CULSO
MDPGLEGRLSALLAMSNDYNLDETSNAAEAEPVEEFAVNSITNEQLKSVGETLGRIHTCFPEISDVEFEGRNDFPKSYKTLSLKERLLLLFAENFRRQYNEKHPNRKPLILCLENECGIQKFVATTIKPTVFLYPELIDNWQGCASFIADHIIYEPLEDQIKIPKRLLSPETIIRRRKGNSFEMATLLCSLLIGNGFPACVVYGYATREVVNNDLRRVVCPFIPKNNENTDSDEESKQVEIKPPNKYALKEPPPLTSSFVKEMKQRELDEIRKIEEAKQEEERRKLQEIESLPPDEYEGSRIHAWVAIIRYAQWSYKPDDRERDAEGERLPPQAFFIEPSTGFRHEVDDPGYLGIECLWNQHNYYVNIQEPLTDIKNMRWDLSNTKDWEHLLPGEPYECRENRPLPDDVEALTLDEELAKEKHLDMPVSWVQRFDILLPDYEERFVNGEKTEFYKRAVYERFAPYKQLDGLVKRLTLYETLDYENPFFRWEWYENRDDLLEMVKVDFSTKQIEEYFQKGRADAMKAFIRNTDDTKGKIFKFYHTPRFDALKELHCYSDYIKEFYDKRKDLLHYREFKTSKRVKMKDIHNTESGHQRKLTQITEKFHRNPKLQAIRDIAIRHFYLNENKIFLQFHYDTDCITASTRIFQKLPESEMGEDVQFDPATTTGYISNPNDKQMSNVELYLLLKQLMLDEEKSCKAYQERLIEVEQNLKNRQIQDENPKLMFTIFDPLRNEAARKLRMERYEQMRIREELAKTQLADFLAPYLVRLGSDRKLSKAEYDLAKKDCLSDFRQYYLDMLNELQRRFEELTKEEESLRRFLHKFQSQFDDYDYEKFIKEGENIVRNKRIIQKRIENVSEELDRKYKTLKEALDNDERLTEIEKANESKLKFTE